MSGTSLLPEPERPLKEVIEEAISKAPEKQRLSKGLADREELFCQAYVKHNDALRAVQDAGYTINSPKAARIKAWKLLHADKINARILTLREIAATRNNLSVDVVVGMIRDVYEKSMEVGKYTDSLGACKMLGDYLDIFKAKPQSVTNIGILSDRAVLDKEIKRLAAAAGVPLLTSNVVEAEYEIPDSTGEGGGSGDGGSPDGPSPGELREGCSVSG